MKKIIITTIFTSFIASTCIANPYIVQYHQYINKAYQNHIKPFNQYINNTYQNHITPLDKNDELNRSKAYVTSGFAFYGLGTFLSTRYKRNPEKGSRSFSIKPNILTRSLKSLGKGCMFIPVVKLFSDLCYSKIE